MSEPRCGIRHSADDLSKKHAHQCKSLEASNVQCRIAVNETANVKHTKEGVQSINDTVVGFKISRGASASVSRRVHHARRRSDGEPFVRENTSVALWE
jgi:hypothetical protein